MRRMVLSVVGVVVLACAPGAMAAQMVRPSYSDSFGFGYEDSGTSAYLGVDISEVTPERVTALKLKEEQGVEVLLVDQDSPAGKAGLKEHDVILTLNGAAVESGAQLRRMIHETPPGRTVTLGVSRDGEMQTIKAQLAERKKSPGWKDNGKDGYTPVFPPIPPIPPIPNFSEMEIPNVVVVHSSMRSGLMVENLTPQLGEFFGAKGGNGVLVRSVEKGSVAAKAGLRAGDIIVRVNGEAVTDVSDFSHALRSHQGGTASVGVIRDKREQTISLPVMERKQTGMLEEGLEAPDLDVDVDINLEDITTKIAKLEPTLQLAAQNAQLAIEKARKSLCQEQSRMKLDKEKLSRELKKQQRQLQILKLDRFAPEPDMI
jgi:serine protease Do